MLSLPSCGDDEIIICDDPTNPNCPNFDICTRKEKPIAGISAFDLLTSPVSCSGITPFEQEIAIDTYLG